MARQTRQQRRERRAEQGEPPRPPARRQVRAAAEPPREPTPVRAAPGGGLLRFIRESWGELKKVEWPGQQQVITGTTVVIIACIIVGAYLYANDLVWKRVVENLLLK